MDYHVERRQVTARPLAVVRRVAKQADLPRVVPACCGEVWNFVRAAGISGAGRHVAVYLDDVMHIEVGVEVAAPIAGDGNVVPSATPAGSVAAVLHVGPYQLLDRAYAAIETWCQANQQTPAGVYWEVYGHGTDDVSKAETEVFCLLKS